MRVLLLPRYGRLAGSSRYMSYDYLPYYTAAGFQCSISPLLDDRYLALSRRLSGFGTKLIGVGPYLLKQALVRLGKVMEARLYDVIVLEKDVIPYAPYLLEIGLFSARRPVVVHYDEPIYTHYASARNPMIRAMTRGKIERILRQAAHVIVWNEEVRDYVATLNRNVTLVHTGIDLTRYRVKESYEITNRAIRVGWIGSPSGYAYLHTLDDVFADLAREYEFELYVVSSQPYIVEGVKVINRPWGIDTEVEDLRAMDIGIMPLPDTAWAAGKSGCKMFQYMGVGLPVVVSPVGINARVIENERNGLLARTPDEWRHQLVRLMTDATLRQKLGQAGRAYVAAHNSQAAVAETLVNVLRRAVA